MSDTCSLPSERDSRQLGQDDFGQGILSDNVHRDNLNWDPIIFLPKVRPEDPLHMVSCSPG